MGIFIKSEPAAGARKSGWRTNVGLVLGSVALSLLLAEGLLRWVGHPHPQWDELDPLVGWRPRPGLTGWYSGEVDNYIAINQAGYRDIDHPLVKSGEHLSYRAPWRFDERRS